MVALTRATDEVARGRYDVVLPRMRKRDEIGRLTERFRDMTRRLAEAEERERNFLMSVSHELRTPLTAIRGHVDALAEGLVEDAESREASLDVIRTESDRLARLVGDLLDLARLDAHRFNLAQDEVELCDVAVLQSAWQRSTSPFTNSTAVPGVPTGPPPWAPSRAPHRARSGCRPCPRLSG